MVNTKVTLVVHSMGGLVSLHFLTGFAGIDQNWKDQYIHAYVTVAAAWSGGAASLRNVISNVGPNWIPRPIRGMISRYIVPILRTFESLPWLFPKPTVFDADTVVVSTPAREYTVSEYQDLFNDIGYANGYQFFQQVQAINHNYPAPNVPTHCFYGNIGDSTPERFTYNRNFNGQANTIGLRPQVTNGDGDGTVNIVSSRVCHRWSNMPQQYPFRYRVFDNAEHTAIVQDRRLHDEIREIVGAPEQRDILRMIVLGGSK